MISVSCALGLAAWLLVACRSTSLVERYSYSHHAMGCEARVVLYAPDEVTATRAAEAAFARIDAIEQALSDWRDDSDAERLCGAAGQGPQAVSADLRDCLTRAVELSVLSEGAFDPTIGAVTRLWRRAKREQRMPSADELAAARALVGVQHLTLHADGKVEIHTRGVRLDFGAIGKGWACDRALDTLAAHGITSALVELGGDLACSAPPPGRTGWTISAGNGTQAEDARLSVAHCGVATSGDDAQGWLVDGQRLSHIVRPQTADALRNTSRVTVVAANGADADALATAVEVLGTEKGADLAQKREARLVVQPR
jgi:thiamine biosynthesis lipoprotein